MHTWIDLVITAIVTFPVGAFFGMFWTGLATKNKEEDAYNEGYVRGRKENG